MFENVNTRTRPSQAGFQEGGRGDRKGSLGSSSHPPRSTDCWAQAGGGAGLQSRCGAWRLLLEWAGGPKGLHPVKS